MDLDGDGKISREEADVHAWIKAAAGHDGVMSQDEMYQLLVKVAKERRTKRHLVQAIVVAVVLIILLVAAIFGAVWGVNAAFLNADKKETSDGDRVLAVNNEIVGSRTAVQYLPLFAATAMPPARLGEVTKLTVTFKTGAPPDMFELVAPSIIIGAARTYDVVGATQVSPTEMYFDTNAPGAATQRIHVKDGKATTTRSRTTLPLPPLITSSLSVS